MCRLNSHAFARWPWHPEYACLSLKRRRRRAVSGLGQAVANQAANVLEGVFLIKLSHREETPGTGMDSTETASEVEKE